MYVFTFDILLEIGKEVFFSHKVISNGLEKEDREFFMYP